MKKLDLSDVKNIYEYEKVREEMCRRIIDLKRRRRVQVGKYLCFVFENRETALFQIQEMCRVERIVDEAKIREEVEVYNDLIPGENELSATLLIEIEDRAEIQPVLDRLMGIDAGEHVWIQVGKDYAIPAQFEPGHSDADRGKLSAVHFIRFAFPPGAIEAFKKQDAYLVVDHPGEKARTRIADEVKASLFDDFTS
ncbi:MAG: hypothetical protein A3I03_04135 [Candidatus Rokubacteria bacterium RIFCSPLOWO2_02_FULL_68_19]|nr:MAG: hypothetical protein A3I03_04135 [Candidatus Rokubacteria bacterium RIFCSPLOWO2_02_FULL_68_19]